MQDRRRSSSTFDDLLSTAQGGPAVEFRRSTRALPKKGMTRRGERIFNIASSVVILLFAIGWSWSIALARGSVGRHPASETTGIIASALTDADAPAIAYLTDAALDVVTPLRGESGTLKAKIGEPGAVIQRDTLNTAVATIPEGNHADSTAVLNTPRKTGILSLAIALGNSI